LLDNGSKRLNTSARRSDGHCEINAKRQGRKEGAKEQEMERREASGLMRVTGCVFLDGKEVAMMMREGKEVERFLLGSV
jgi:hypothetical protein